MLMQLKIKNHLKHNLISLELTLARSVNAISAINLWLSNSDQIHVIEEYWFCKLHAGNIDKRFEQSLNTDTASEYKYFRYRYLGGVKTLRLNHITFIEDVSTPKIKYYYNKKHLIVYSSLIIILISDIRNLLAKCLYLIWSYLCAEKS